MKRTPELLQLSREHHQSLRLARQCLETAASGDTSAIATLCARIAGEFDQTWAQHFYNEELSIFSITEHMGEPLSSLGRRLVAEHERMRELARLFAQGNYSKLYEFGELLKAHTRTEERELFPLIEAHFTPEQLRFVEQTQSLSRSPEA